MKQSSLLIVIVFFVFNCACNHQNTGPASIVYNECGRTISKYQFILQSLNYPKKYPSNIECEYVLEGHYSCATEFHFQLLDFDLPVWPNCSDFLEIGGNDKLCGHLTGVRMYRTERGGNLRLKFTTKNSYPGKGFKILITRLPCSANNERLNVTVTHRNFNSLYPNHPKCCADSYNSRRFYLASPGFPKSNQYPGDCVYNIHRSNPNICRLRIHFKFFWTGLQEQDSCSNGFLEIDGKRICGCHSELDVISQFDQYWGDTPKVLRFKNQGLPRSDYNGFVIEVIQDECPTRYSPDLETRSSSNANKKEKVPQFYYYNDQLNRIKFPDEEDKNSPKEYEVFNNNKRLNSGRPELKDIRLTNPKVWFDYYFFKAPDYDYITNGFDKQEREDREFVETTDPDFRLPQSSGNEQCTKWNLDSYKTLINEVLWKKMPQCKVTQHLEPNCYDIKLSKGILLSPGYPLYYYPNTKCCYRFHKLGGYCGIQFTVFDFNLEASENCNKDSFILYEKYKYCGNYLQNKHFTFDLKSKPFEDIRFQTDSYYCGRGFKIYFEHTPCKFIPEVEHTTRPPKPTTMSPYPTVVLPTRPPAVRPSCGGDINTEFFDLEIQNVNEVCVYTVNKFNQNVCAIQIMLLHFDLSCNNEYLILDDRQFCGRKNGDMEWVPFDTKNSLTIAYRRRSEHRPVLSSIVLRGQQIVDNCSPIMEPPAQRILKSPEKNIN